MSFKKFHLKWCFWACYLSFLVLGSLGSLTRAKQIFLVCDEDSMDLEALHFVFIDDLLVLATAALGCEADSVVSAMTAILVVLVVVVVLRCTVIDTIVARGTTPTTALSTASCKTINKFITIKKYPVFSQETTWKYFHEYCELFIDIKVKRPKYR